MFEKSFLDSMHYNHFVSYIFLVCNGTVKQCSNVETCAYSVRVQYVKKTAKIRFTSYRSLKLTLLIKCPLKKIYAYNLYLFS